MTPTHPRSRTRNWATLRHPLLATENGRLRTREPVETGTRRNSWRRRACTRKRKKKKKEGKPQTEEDPRTMGWAGVRGPFRFMDDFQKMDSPAKRKIKLPDHLSDSNLDRRPYQLCMLSLALGTHQDLSQLLLNEYDIWSVWNSALPLASFLLQTCNLSQLRAPPGED